MIDIRAATQAELSSIIAIAPAGDERRAAIAEWIAAGQCHFASRDGVAVGYVALTRNFFRSPFIEMLVVSESARRQGIGRSLIRHCIELTRPDEKLWTSTNESNTPMRIMLPALGFVESGRVEELDPGDPELIFQLRR